MKKMIRASSFKQIDSVKFTNGVIDHLRKLLPEECRVVSNPRYDEIKIENPPEESKVEDIVINALANAGYDVYMISDIDSEGYDLAAVRGDAFVKISIDIGDYFDNGLACYLSLKYDNGNVLFEDWYDEV